MRRWLRSITSSPRRRAAGSSRFALNLPRGRACARSTRPNRPLASPPKGSANALSGSVETQAMSGGGTFPCRLNLHRRRNVLNVKKSLGHRDFQRILEAVRDPLCERKWKSASGYWPSQPTVSNSASESASIRKRALYCARSRNASSIVTARNRKLVRGAACATRSRSHWMTVPIVA